MAITPERMKPTNLNDFISAFDFVLQNMPLGMSEYNLAILSVCDEVTAQQISDEYTNAGWVDVQCTTHPLKTLLYLKNPN